MVRTGGYMLLSAIHEERHGVFDFVPLLRLERVPFFFVSWECNVVFLVQITTHEVLGQVFWWFESVVPTTVAVPAYDVA